MINFYHSTECQTKMTALFTDTAMRTSNITQSLKMPQVSLPQYAPTFSEFLE
jgi:hypothetical protein